MVQSIFYIILVLCLVSLFIYLLVHSRNQNIHREYHGSNESKLILQTFADGKVFTYDRLLLEGRVSGYFSEVHGATLKDLDPFWVNRHRDFIARNKRGYGYWIWKPRVIKERLAKMNDGDYLLWLDSGFVIQGGVGHIVNDYIKQTDSILTFRINSREGDWTKMDTIIHLLDDPADAINRYQVCAGIILMRKCQLTIDIIDEWVEIMNNYHLIDDTPSVVPNDSGFKEHRHDGSVFSMLRLKYGLPESMGIYSTKGPDAINEWHFKDGSIRPFVPQRLRN